MPWDTSRLAHHITPVIRKAWSTGRAAGPGAPVLWEQKASIVCHRLMLHCQVNWHALKPLPVGIVNLTFTSARWGCRVGRCAHFEAIL